MATVLASQLQELSRQRQAALPVTVKKGKASLLFDFRKAADVDLQTIYDIASQGFDELVRLEPRFRPYRESLFSRASLDINPELQTTEFLSKLDESIYGFCCLLSNHFLAPSAFKALEYLVRRYKANERNVDALMTAALPYHSTNEFSRLVQILALGPPGSLWGWLSKMQTSGASLPRDLLALRCVNDRQLLLFVCKIASQLGGGSGAAAAIPAAARPRNHTFLSFYAVLLCEVLAVVPSVSEELLASLLPYLLEGLAAGAAQDYRAATLMAVAELCSRATLGRDFVKVMLNTMLKHTEPVPEHIRTVLLVLAHLAVTQRHIRVLADKTLKYFSGLPHVVSELTALAQRGNIRLGPLLLLLTRSLASALGSTGSTSRRCQADLLALAHSGILRGEPAHALAKSLLEAGGAADSSDAVRSSCQQVLRVLDQRYPETTDAAVNAYLEPLRTLQQRNKTAAAAPDAAADKDSNKKSKRQKKDKKKSAAESDDDVSDVDMDAVPESADAAAAELTVEDRARFEFVRATFSSGGYSAPCGGTMMTLTAALAAPQAAIRRMALQQLDSDLASAAPAGDGSVAAAAATDATSEARTALTAAALERLRDDDLGVVLAALGLSCIKCLPSAALLDALQPLSYRLGEYMYGSAKLRQLKAARKAARKVIGLLRSVGGAGASEQLRQAAALQVTAFLLPSHRDPRVCVDAARAAGELGLPLLAGLSGVVKELESHLKAPVDPSASSKTKGKKSADAAPEATTHGGKKVAPKSAAAAIERTVVSALAKTLAADVPARSQELLALIATSAAAAASDDASCAPSKRTQHLLLLAAHAAAASSQFNPEGKTALLRIVARVAEMLLPYTRFARSVSDWSADFAEQVSPADGLPTPAHAPALHSDPFSSHAALILGSLRVSLAHLPEADDATANPSAAVRDLGLLAGLGFSAEKLRDLPLLVTTRFLQPSARSAFLAGLYIAPSSSSSAPGVAATTVPALQCLALHIQAQLAETARDDVVSWLPCLLAALGVPNSSVRSAACDCLARVGALLESAGPKLETAASLCKALMEHLKVLCTDPDAARVLLRSALLGETATAGPAVKPSKTKGKAAAASAAAGDSSAAHLNLSAAGVAAVVSYLTSSLDRLDVDAAGVTTATAIMSCLGPSDPVIPAAATSSSSAVSTDLFAAGARYLARLASKLRDDPSSATDLHAVLVRHLMALYTPPSVAAAAAASQEDGLSRLAEVAELLPPPLTSTAASASAALAAARHAAVSRVTPELFAALPSSGRTVRELFAVLMSRYEGDPDETVRAAARAALEAIPLSADLLVPLLDPPSSSAAAAAPVAAAPAAAIAATATPAKPSKKKSRKSEAAGAAATPADATATVVASSTPAPPPPLEPAALRDAVAALELLQWRTGISGPHLLVAACQSLLRRELPIVGSIATTLPAEDSAAPDEETTVPAADADQAADRKSSLAGYAATLALQALASLSQQDASAATGGMADDAKEEEVRRVLASFDLALAVRMAREAPDAAVRNAALGLLTALATKTPEEALTHVLQVLAVINQSAAVQDDEHSRAVGATALAAVVPAWVAAEQPSSALWEQVVGSLPSLPTHRRLDVLLSLMRALPKVEDGLSEGLLVLLQHAASPHKPSAPAAAATDPTPSKPSSKKGAEKKAAKEVAEAGPAAVPEGTAPAAPPPSEWLPELASQLALQVDLPIRLACCARVMELALTASRQQPQTALPRTVVAFVTAQLKLKAAVTAASASYRRPDPDPALEAACRRLMQAALAQMQLLQPDTVASVHGSTASPRASQVHRAVLASSRGLYALFAALQGVMAADVYLQALLTLAEHPADKVKRRAIKLFTDKVRGVRAEIEDQIDLPQRVREAKLRQAGEAAARACVMLPPLLHGAASSGAGASPLTRQLALVALAAIASEFGSRQHAELLAGVPAVLEATKDTHASIRASALATVASFVRALGSKLVPVLPATVAAAVAAADSAWARLARAGTAAVTAGQDAEMREADDDGAAGGASGSGEDGGSGSGADYGLDSDDEDAPRRLQGRGKKRGNDQEEAALELSSALACLNALVETLGGFLSPHLHSVLAILLNPRVLACCTAGCDKFAASIRARLPTVVPARLLLPALYDRLQPCIDAAADAADASTAAAPATALLQMVALAAAALEPKLAAQYHDHMFAFLLRALDVRQRRPAALAAHGDAALDAVEVAAVRALVALVMKLSEAKFKPMFLRMLEWASTLSTPEAGGEPSYLGRMVALFGAVNALADRLRSVVVPYYRYLLDLCVQHLGDDDVTAGASKARGKKKQKRVAAAAEAASGAATGEAYEVQQRLAWLLRLRIIRALHRCFLHDSVGFMDADRFARLQPVLVSQLDVSPPDAAVPYLLSPSHADLDLASYLTLGAATRAYTAANGALASGPVGAGTVGCLLAMAVAANNDALWKPLNHATLMLTRSAAPRTRALALEVVAQLVDRLREEYLVLLPESLPFMSELLEDGDASVAARVREVIAQLEEISGEKLDEYLKV